MGRRAGFALLLLLGLLLACPDGSGAASSEAVRRNNFGGELLKQGKLEEAAAEFRQAVALDPGYATAHLNLGYAYDKLERSEEAIASYKRGVELDPRSPFGWNNLGVLYNRTGRYEEAVQALEAGLKLEPANTTLQANLDHARKNQAILAERQGMITEMQKQAAARPTDPVPARELLRLYALSGQAEQALEWLQKTLQRGWRDVKALAAAPELAELRRTDPRFRRLLEGR